MAFWERKSGKLRQFRLADSKGEVWTSAKVAGKTLIIHLWASYSAPSVMEMALFKSLAERLSGSKDFQILSFNVDEDLNAFKEAVEGKSFPYPVMAAYFFVAEIVKFATVPRTWIVGPDGVWQWERSGSDRDAKTFLADLGRRVTLPPESEAEPPATAATAAPVPDPAPDHPPAPAATTAESPAQEPSAAPSADEPPTNESPQSSEADTATTKRARKKKS